MAYAGSAAVRGRVSDRSDRVSLTDQVTTLQPGWWAARDAAAVQDDLVWQHRERALLISGRPRHDGQVLTADMLESLAQSLATRGTAALDALHGGYALAWIDAATDTVLLAVDRMGIGDLYFACDDAGFAFGTSVAQVRAAAGRHFDVSSQAIFEYLYFHAIPSPRTIFEGIVRLQPGEYVQWRNARMEQGFHWQARFVETERASFDDLKREFIGALEHGVRDAMQRADGQVGAFLSGGTDSSTIAGLATRVGGAPIDTYSIGFDAAGYDEMEYARIASRHFGTRHHEYYVTPADVVDAIPRIAGIHAQPFGNASAVPTYHCARIAKADGMTAMLAGDGGDELFGGNARYAKQYLFSLYERVPAVLRRAVVEPTCAVLARGPRLPLVSKGVSYVRQAAQPMPARLETYNGLVRLGLDVVMTEGLCAAVDPQAPLRAIEQWYFNPTAHTQINRMLAADFKFTLADSDLPKVTTSCRLAGMPVAYPMLDDAVLDFSLRLAPDFKLKGTALRWFFKQALRDVLPDAILRKSKHGFGLPFGEWALSNAELRAVAFDSLNSLKQRDLVQPAFITRLCSGLLAEYPGYYGPLVWVLMMLEQWFIRHGGVQPLPAWAPLASGLQIQAAALGHRQKMS